MPSPIPVDEMIIGTLGKEPKLPDHVQWWEQVNTLLGNHAGKGSYLYAYIVCIYLN